MHIQNLHTSINIGIHGFPQFVLIFFDLLCIASENAINYHKGVEYRPFTLISFEIFHFTFIVIAKLNANRYQLVNHYLAEFK